MQTKGGVSSVRPWNITTCFCHYLQHRVMGTVAKHPIKCQDLKVKCCLEH